MKFNLPELSPTPRAILDVEKRQVFLLGPDYEYTAFAYLVIDGDEQGLYDEDGNLLLRIEDENKQ